MTTYLLDSDIFIRAKNDHYGFDFFPAFWDWLIGQSKAGRVSSIKAIHDELIQRPDPDDEDDRRMFSQDGSGKTAAACFSRMTSQWQTGCPMLHSGQTLSNTRKVQSQHFLGSCGLSSCLICSGTPLHGRYE